MLLAMRTQLGIVVARPQPSLQFLDPPGNAEDLHSPHRETRRISRQRSRHLGGCRHPNRP